MSKAFLALSIPKVVSTLSNPWMFDGAAQDITVTALAVLTFVILTVNDGKGGGTFRRGNLFVY